MKGLGRCCVRYCVRHILKPIPSSSRAGARKGREHTVITVRVKLAAPIKLVYNTVSGMAGKRRLKNVFVHKNNILRCLKGGRAGYMDGKAKVPEKVPGRGLHDIWVGGLKPCGPLGVFCFCPIPLFSWGFPARHRSRRSRVTD